MIPPDIHTHTGDVIVFTMNPPPGRRVGAQAPSGQGLPHPLRHKGRIDGSTTLPHSPDLDLPLVPDARAEILTIPSDDGHHLPRSQCTCPADNLILIHPGKSPPQPLLRVAVDHHSIARVSLEGQTAPLGVPPIWLSRLALSTTLW